MRVRLPLPAAPVFTSHHVGALISGRNSGWPCPRQADTTPPLPDILGRQVKSDKLTWERGPLTGWRGMGPAGRWSPGLARGLLEVVGRPEGRMSLPGDWPQLFIATTQVPAGDSPHLYPRVGCLEGTL